MSLPGALLFPYAEPNVESFRGAFGRAKSHTPLPASFCFEGNSRRIETGMPARACNRRLGLRSHALGIRLAAQSNFDPEVIANAPGLGIANQDTPVGWTDREGHRKGEDVDPKIAGPSRCEDSPHIRHARTGRAHPQGQDEAEGSCHRQRASSTQPSRRAVRRPGAALTRHQIAIPRISMGERKTATPTPHRMNARRNHGRAPARARPVRG